MAKFRVNGIYVETDTDAIESAIENGEYEVAEELVNGLREEIFRKGLNYTERGGESKAWVTRYRNAYQSAGGEIDEYVDRISHSLASAVPKLKDYIREWYIYLTDRVSESIVEDIEDMNFDVRLELDVSGKRKYGSISGNAVAENWRYRDSMRVSLLDVSRRHPNGKRTSKQGLDNVIRAFNNGWSASGPAYGVWTPTKGSSKGSDGKRIVSRPFFSGLFFIQKAIAEYNNNRGRLDPFITLLPSSIYYDSDHDW